ncbi:MAG: DUF5103 domain-containing protein [Prevotellaceae bacterium]|jgi:hypothetical protein|nr:DUF5103 domain-containing protein [Prevotellaceae bacterium]
MRLFSIILILINHAVYSQNFQEINAKAGFKDFCFSGKIYSVQLFKTGDRLSDPVILLNSSETVTLVFDELIRNDETEEDYYYTLEHRDANWKEENLVTGDYMSGFPENYIDEVNQSHGTVLSYRNFVVTLPNDKVNLKLSGNYLIKIFERDSGKLALVKGFSIIEPLAAINVSDVTPAGIPCMQQFGFETAYPSLKVIDAYRNFTVRIEQNFAAVPGIEPPQPAFVRPGSADYTRPDRNIYSGRNEYRAFDIRSLTHNGQGVASHFFDGVHRTVLVRDTERSDYLSARDINGKYMIASDNSTDSDTQSEYVDVLFSFAPKKPVEGRIFLFGELTCWSVAGKYEMQYIDDSYKCIVPLKQGFYNYQYVIMDKNGNLDMNAAEGCFYETENVYNIYVYYRLPEHRYDRLAGFRKVTNRQSRQ